MFWLVVGSLVAIALFLGCMAVFINSDVFDPKDPMDEQHYE